MSKQLKKYPVIYKDEEYEVRWEKVFDANRYYNNYNGYVDTMVVYKVTKQKSFINYVIYKQVFSKEEIYIIDELRLKGFTKQYPNFYIEEVKELFKKYQEQLDKDLREQNKLQALKEWDGVIINEDVKLLEENANR